MVGIEINLFICSITLYAGSSLLYIVATYYFSKTGSSPRNRGILYWIRMLTGWLLFIGMIGIWFSPQPSLYYHILFLAEILNTEETLFIVVIKALGIVFLIVGAILGLSGVLALSIRTSGFHVKKELVTKNIYKYVRHPQYLGAILSHIGISLLTTELYSFLATPLVIALFYTMSIAEDKELESIFGEEFRKYKKMTGRFIPKFHYR